MNIRFLGTGFGAPYKNRHQQAILVEVGDASYLFDAGAPVTDILSFDGYDMSCIRAVFISHLHGDHINGLNDMINLAEFFGIRTPVYLSEQRGIDAFEQYTYMQLRKPSDRIEFRLIGPDTFYDDGVLQVTAYHNMHMSGMPCYCFVIEAEGKRICITGDLSPTLQDLPPVLYDRDTDLLVTECAHFEADTLLTELTKTKVYRVAFVHVMPPERYEDIIESTVETHFEKLCPRDGDIYEV